MCLESERLESKMKPSSNPIAYKIKIPRLQNSQIGGRGDGPDGQKLWGTAKNCVGEGQKI